MTESQTAKFSALCSEARQLEVASKKLQWEACLLRHTGAGTGETEDRLASDLYSKATQLRREAIHLAF